MLVGLLTAPANQSFVNGNVSFWHTQLGIEARRDRLPGRVDADVCLVGGGLTALWTAYYLKRHQPDLHVVILEREFVGFGASGRHGGWLSDELAGSRRAMAAQHGRTSVLRLLSAMTDSVEEVIRICEIEHIDADIARGGFVTVARNSAQTARLQMEFEEERLWPRGDASDCQLLDADALREHISVNNATSGLYNPHAARVHPAKLVRGVAHAAERLGVKIFEGTGVTSIEPGMARTTLGNVHADVVINCLEGYQSGLDSDDGTVIPLNSTMVVTDPIPDQTWTAIGWPTPVLVTDQAHAYMYAQRTADGRIALGGRGVPYRVGSRTDDRGRTQQRAVDQLTAILHSMFPAARSTRIAHAWCGVLGVRRNWTPSIAFDRASGTGRAGAYVGNGVTTTNLAGRTMADLITGNDSDLTDLPWINTTSRRWEPEPFRWVGAQLVYALYRAADRRESATAKERTHYLARIANTLSGR